MSAKPRKCVRVAMKQFDNRNTNEKFTLMESLPYSVYYPELKISGKDSTYRRFVRATPSKAPISNFWAAGSTIHSKNTKWSTRYRQTSNKTYKPSKQNPLGCGYISSTFWLCLGLSFRRTSPWALLLNYKRAASHLSNAGLGSVAPLI